VFELEEHTHIVIGTFLPGHEAWIATHLHPSWR
jgi:hypothetical protein